MDLAKDLRTLRGVCIALIVLSVFGLVCNLLAMVLFGFGFDIAFQETQYGHHYDSTEVAALHFAEAIIFILFALVLIGKVVALVAAVFGNGLSSNPGRVRSAFVLAVIGAVLMFLVGSLVSAVLLVVAAVYLHRMRNVPAEWILTAANAPKAAPGQPMPNYVRWNGSDEYVTTPMQPVNYPAQPVAPGYAPMPQQAQPVPVSPYAPQAAPQQPAYVPVGAPAPAPVAPAPAPASVAPAEQPESPAAAEPVVEQKTPATSEPQNEEGEEKLDRE